MKIHKIPRTDISRYPNNPRKNGNALAPVKASIDAFGFVQPLVLDKSKTIIIGHSRFDCTEDDPKWETLPCIIVDLPPDKARALRIADNSTHEFSTWDNAKLMEELKELEAGQMTGSMQAFFKDFDVAAELAKMGAPLREFTGDGPGKEVRFKPGGKQSLVPVVCPKCDHTFNIDRRQIK